ncbi:hypothetical protein CDAR_51971 [Caerostris darwini]|uniref:Uncharacterized protein n=1 Tax=Caerostris darwini TaxID=1538125 RepID=A0AAV4MMX4_9ARAC|nr:hypothetical protein CDAR_51971 [Caerostris darwini]
MIYDSEVMGTPEKDVQATSSIDRVLECFLGNFSRRSEVISTEIFRILGQSIFCWRVVVIKANAEMCHWHQRGVPPTSICCSKCRNPTLYPSDLDLAYAFVKHLLLGNENRLAVNLGTQLRTALKMAKTINRAVPPTLEKSEELPMRALSSQTSDALAKVNPVSGRIKCLI